MTKKNNTNKKSLRNITISQILEGQEDDFQFYRDIFIYILVNYKNKIKNKNEDVKIKQEKRDEEDEETSDSEFRVWDLSKWLLKNNRQLREATHGSKESTYSKTHSKIQNVSSSLNKLIDLGLAVISKEKEPSLRNPKIPTNVYDVTLLGMLVASIIELRSLTKGTLEYQEALKSLLRLWISFIPPGNKDWSNYNYYFLKGLVEKSLENHDDLLLSFIEFIRERSPDLIFNFGDLRYKINYVIFEKLISDIKFRELYLDWLNLFSRENPIPTNTKELIKFQFKLDIETQYERSLSQLLNFSSHSIKTLQWGMKPNNKNLTYKEVMENEHFDNINSEIVFDYNLKNQWEQVRNNTLLNCDKITILVKCSKCGSIYPLQLEIFNEVEDLSNLIHRYGSLVKIYDHKNDTNAIYLKRMLSTRAVI